MDDLNRYIDHTQIKPFASESDMDTLLNEAKQFSFASACLAPCWVSKASLALRETGIAVCTIVGFPLGSSTTESKAKETSEAVLHGADEIDMVLNIGFLKSHKHDEVLKDIASVVTAAQSRIVKVILETCYLSDEEIVLACTLAKDAGAHFVKTSTGFGPGNRAIEHVKLMKKTIGESLLIKASGGIRDKETAIKMIEAGANRIGTSSGVSIMQGEEAACVY